MNTKNPHPKVAIIILNWNNYGDTAECLKSVAHIRYPNLEIVLVDNGSRDGSATALKKEFSQYKLLSNPVNLGFAGGNNVGIEFALKAGADYILLLNNDATVSPDFLDVLVEFGQGHEQAGILGPKVFFYNQPGKIWSMGGYFRRAKGSMNTLGHNQPDSDRFQRNIEVDYVPGCAILIKRDVFEKIGLLDEDYFFFAEESDFCLRAKKNGFQVFVVPASRIWHKASQALGHVYSPLYIYFRSRNRLLLVFKNFGLLYFGYGLLFHLGIYLPYTIAKIFATRKRVFKSLYFLGLGLVDALIYVLRRKFTFSRRIIA
ncbi:MAG: glycosyltransferase family 2 protein [Candidatus Aminicenantales bacterium]